MRKAFAIVISGALVAAAVPILVGASGPAAASGGIQVEARDAQHRPASNLTVQIRNVSTGQLAATGTTNAAGQFVFVDLTPATYVVEVVNAAGKIAAATAPVAVTAGRTSTVTVTTPPADDAKAAAGGGLFSSKAGVIGVASAAAAVGITAMVVTRSGKVVICHKPAGEAAHTIEVSENAKDAHLAHGDTLGACPLSPSR